MMPPTDHKRQHAEVLAERHLPTPVYAHGIPYEQSQIILNIKEPSFAMEDLLNIPMVCLSLLICHKGMLFFPSNSS